MTISYFVKLSIKIHSKVNSSKWIAKLTICCDSIILARDKNGFVDHMFEFLPCLHYFDEELYSCVRKEHRNGFHGYPQNRQNTSKEKISPASNATVIDWSFDAADNYCQNGQEISRHRRATSFTRANERGHT